MINKESASYWLLSDDRLDICNNPLNYDYFRAHFKHTLLFNKNVIVPDSYIVNNLNFRKAIKYDEDISGLVADQILQIALRTDGDEDNSLVKIRDAFSNTVKPKEFSNEEYYSNEELVLLDNTVQFLPYSIKDVSKSYSSKVQALFNSEVAHTIIDNKVVGSKIREFLNEKYEAEGKLGRAFFYYDLEPLLGEKSWEEYGDKIKDIANAPYLTALPSLLGADPVYANEHKGAFDIISGRVSIAEREAYNLKFSSKLGLQSFVKGMTMLKRDSILDLLDSDEAEHYFDASIGNPSSKDYIQNLQEAIKNYQLKIEDEIIRAHYFLKNESNDGMDKKIENKFSEYMTVAGDLTTVLSTTFSALSSLSPLGLLFTNPVKEVIKKVIGIENVDAQSHIKQAISEREWKRDEILDEYKKKNEKRVDAQGLFTPTGKETLYK